MISSLPPELLALIIESTIPHTFHSTTYRDRQRTLCSLSVVSKTFRSIAQPLLLEIVWIRSPEQLDLVPARGGQDRLGGLRAPCVIVTLGVCSRPKGVTDAELITEVVKRFPSLSGFLWGHEASTDPELAFLCHLYNLSTLQLSGLGSPISNPRPLANLRSLSLHDASLAILLALLDPNILPNLRHFALGDYDDESVAALRSSRFARLLPQLESLSFDMRMWTNPEMTFLHEAAKRTLIDCSFGNVSHVDRLEDNVVNVRLYAAWVEASEAEEEERTNLNNAVYTYLDIFTSSLERFRSRSLRRLYLDPTIEPSPTSPTRASTVMEKLASVCRQRGIDIVFEAVPRSFWRDPIISADFIRCQEQVGRVEQIGE